MVHAAAERGRGSRAYPPTPAPDARAAELQCAIAPGVYAIIDARTGELIGVLIIYPDCKVEILPT